MASIRQLSNSNWQVQVRRTGHKPITKTFSIKADATKWARQIESEIDRGVFLDRTEADRTTLAELLKRYLDEVTPKKRSAAREKSRLSLLKQYFGHYMVSSLQSKHVAQFRDLRIQQGKAGATVIKELNTLSHVLDTAIKDWGLGLVANPVKLIRKPSADRGRSRRLTSNEETLLLASCRKSKAKMLESIVMFAIETGMRISEMLMLEWQDVNLQTRVATLHQTKNGEIRLVPLSTKVIRILETLPRHISEQRVFWEWKGTDSLEHTWRRAVIKSGIMDFRFHDLRHEATSRFFEKGMNVMEVAAITGHKTLQMLKRYTHLKAEDLAKKLG